MYKRYKKRQSGKGLPLVALSTALPFAKAALPWLGKATLEGAASFGVSKILGKIIGGGKKRKRRKRKVRKRKKYKRYVK